nr:hypothetical protein B0A51_05148 [Rachicladosporium sp. CCFEE 5018]OQO28595.1 hypothetical protein B0A51_05414 [Rachicladosporium sp. CCFEE 5018]
MSSLPPCFFLQLSPELLRRGQHAGDLQPLCRRRRFCSYASDAASDYFKGTCHLTIRIASEHGETNNTRGRLLVFTAIRSPGLITLVTQNMSYSEHASIDVYKPLTGFHELTALLEDITRIHANMASHRLTTSLEKTTAAMLGAWGAITTVGGPTPFWTVRITLPANASVVASPIPQTSVRTTCTRGTCLSIKRHSMRARRRNHLAEATMIQESTGTGMEVTGMMVRVERSTMWTV